jgi:hypothetical protein
MVHDIIWKVDCHSPFQKIRFITVFTKARHRTLSWANRIQFAPSIPISLMSIIYPEETPNIPSTKYHVLFPLLRSCQSISPGPRRFETFRNNNNFYGEWLLAPRPPPKLEDHPLSAVHDCLFNNFTATLHIWRPSLSISATRGRAMLRGQGNRLT